LHTKPRAIDYKLLRLSNARHDVVDGLYYVRYVNVNCESC